MCGAIPLFPTTPSWCGAQLEHRYRFTFYLFTISDSGFVMLHGTTYWTDLFVRHFLFQTEHCIDCDDLLFFVRKRHVKGSSRYLPKFEVNLDVIVPSGWCSSNTPDLYLEGTQLNLGCITRVAEEQLLHTLGTSESCHNAALLFGSHCIMFIF
jgi:hypothetical protein